MKKFTLTLLVKNSELNERIEADDIIELLSKFPFVIASVVKKVAENDELMKRIKENDDEIPF